MLKIAYQGAPGAYSHIACQQLFPNQEYVPCDTFEIAMEMVKNGRVTSITGNEIEIKADSICLHGDGVKAVEFAKRIKEELLKNDVEIVPLRELV